MNNCIQRKSETSKSKILTVPENQRFSMISEHANKDVCIFCKISKGEISARKIYENDNFFSIPDSNPKVDGHSLVISKKHFKTILDVPDSLTPELFDCIKKTALKLINEKKAEGFNIINNNFEVAGQIVKHVHFHILPRRKGDGIKMIV